jgi:hypothetical protein
MASIEQDPLMGILEQTPLSMLFFHPSNIETIQGELRFRVYKETGIIVGPQSVKELIIVMRSIFLQDSINRSDNLKQQVVKLNEKVLEYCVKNVSANAEMQKKFEQDIGTLPIPMAHPVGTTGRSRLTFSLHPEESSMNREYSKYPYSNSMRGTIEP